MTMHQYTSKFITRLWSHIDIRSENECWLWQASTNQDGYGRIRLDGRGGKTVSAHRIVFELSIGVYPAELKVCHTCDTPACCNPNHLFLGTHTDNMKDMIAKGRGNKVHGESHHSNKLSTEQVIAIRRRYAEGGITQTELGRQYGVNHSVISAIILRTKWKHIP